MFELTTGYGAEIPVTLKKNSAVFTIQPSATIKAAIVSGDRKQLLAGPVTVLESAPGSDWANSKIIVVFTSTDLANIETGDLTMEIQVDDGGKLPWFVNGTANIGNIS